MTLPRETGHAETLCEDCNMVLKVEVLMSAAGHYIGCFCNCGLYSRESRYYRTREAAKKALASNNYGRE